MRDGGNLMAGGFAIGWRQVGICFLMLAATSMIASSYSIIAVPLGQEFKTSRMTLMLSMTVLSGMGAILTPFVGTLMDKVSTRKILVTGGLFLAAGYSAISLATTFNHVLVAYALLIAPANVMLGPVSSTVLLSRWFVQMRGRAIGIAIAGVGAGGFAFPFIIQGLLNAHEWRDALRLLSLVLIAWIIPAALLVVNRPADRGLFADGADHPSERAKEEQDKSPISAREVISDPAFWMIAGTVSIVTAGMKGMVTNLTPLAMDNGIRASDAALLVSLYSGCSFFAKLGFAALADRVGPRTMMFAALGGFSVGMGLLTQASGGFSSIALGVAMIGMLGGMMVPIESYLAPRVFGQRAVGKAMGLLSGVILVGALSTPPLFGLIFDLKGSYTGMFWTFSGLAAAALLWLPLVRLHARDA